MQEVGLEINEVVGLDDIWAAFAAEHACKDRLHGWGPIPGAHHGISNLTKVNKVTNAS